MTKQNIKEKKQQEQKEYKLINLKFEYPGYTGNEDWAIVSDLSEKDFWQKNKDAVEQYVPFLLITSEQAEAFEEYERFEDKYRKRICRRSDIFGYDDDVSSRFHSELCVYDELSYEMAERIAQEEYRDWQIEIVRKGLDLLTEAQRRRVKAVYFENKTLREVADEEGVNFSKIDKSIQQALKKLKKFLETGGTKPDLCPNE